MIKHHPKILFVAPSVPRECGIAIFTNNLIESISNIDHKNHIDVWAVDDSFGERQYPQNVVGRIFPDKSSNYEEMAKKINLSPYDVIHIQHEFGLYGGKAGSNILHFTERIKKPYIITFHTILSEPDHQQMAVTKKLGAKANKIIVMAEEAVNRLKNIYKIDPRKVNKIPHGVPDMPFVLPNEQKPKIGIGKDRKVISIFGLLSKNKGIEHVLEALPKIIEKVPDLLFLIIGKTHPVILKHEGESYREILQRKVATLRVSNSVKFINRYLTLSEILSYLMASDLYITPYLDKDQITSGTLTYAVGAGRPIISTPYAYAKELLGSAGGRLVEFGDSDSIAHEVVELLLNDSLCLNLSKKSYGLGRSMIWEKVANLHYDLLKTF